jgi:hypothetical protein
MIPNLLAEVERCKRDYPLAWSQAHTGSAQTEDFIRLLAARLHRIDPRFGLNGKRGNPSDISDDVVNYKGEGPGHDPTNNNTPITVIDVIGAAGSPNAYPTWQVFDNLPGPGAWVSPTASPVSPSVPPPAPAPVLPGYPGDEVFDQIGAQLFADYAEAGQSPNAGMSRWFGRTTHDYLAGMSMTQSLAKHRAEWRAALGLPPR